MSAIGFSIGAPSEVEKLRAAYSSLNDITRNLRAATQCIESGDRGMAGHHIRAAEWHASQAKQAIAAVGETKPGAKIQK